MNVALDEVLAQVQSARGLGPLDRIVFGLDLAVGSSSKPTDSSVQKDCTRGRAT